MSGQRTLKLQWVVIANFLNNTGAAFLWPLTTMYMHNYLHQTLTTAGVVLFIMSCMMMAGNYLGGWLFDHWSPYLTALIGAVIATASIILLVFFHGWPIFAILIMVNSFGDGINGTISNSYGTHVGGHSARYVFNVLYMALNMGIVVGTLMVGVLLPIGVTLTFTVAAVFYVLLTLIILLTFNVHFERQSHPKRQPVSHSVNRSGLHHDMIVLVWLICLNYACLHFGYSQWESVMSVHMTNMGIPFWAYSMLWTINGVEIMVGQPLMNLLNGRIHLDTQIMIGVVIFASSFALLVFCHTLPAFIADFVWLTIGEIMSIAGVPAWVSSLTDVDEAGHYQGMVSICMSAGRAIGPLYGGLVIEHASYQVLFLSVAALMLVTLGFVYLGDWHLKKKQA